MAFVTRRWKILLVLNAFAVGGFLTFWGRCSVRMGRSAGQREPNGLRGHARLNGSGVDTGITHDVLLKRLGSLEDVVYRQLNGNHHISSTGRVVQFKGAAVGTSALPGHGISFILEVSQEGGSMSSRAQGRDLRTSWEFSAGERVPSVLCVQQVCPSLLDSSRVLGAGVKGACPPP